jgi:hypothetical protein
MTISSLFSILFIAIALSTSAADHQKPAPGPTLEPMFDGQPLSFWLRYIIFDAVSDDGKPRESGYPEKFPTDEAMNAYNKRVALLRKRAPTAIKSMGTDAIPFLHEQLLTPGDNNQRTWSKEKDQVEIETSPRVIRGQAVHAYIYLKDHRELIEPQLVKLTLDKKQPKETRAAALAALSYISPQRRR